MPPKINQKLRVVKILRPSFENILLLPVFFSAVQAGFPSPAEDYIEQQLDLNNFVVKNKAATFYVRVEGESMTDANIHSGDILVVDRSIEVSHGKIVVAIINGEFTVKRFVVKNRGDAYLMPENPKYPAIKIEKDAQFQVWGVVTYVIHKT